LNPSQLVRVFLCLKKVVSGLERHAGRGTEISKSPPTGTTFMTPADLLGFFMPEKAISCQFLADRCGYCFLKPSSAIQFVKAL